MLFGDKKFISKLYKPYFNSNNITNDLVDSREGEYSRSKIGLIKL